MYIVQKNTLHQQSYFFPRLSYSYQILAYVIKQIFTITKSMYLVKMYRLSSAANFIMKLFRITAQLGPSENVLYASSDTKHDRQALSVYKRHLMGHHFFYRVDLFILSSLYCCLLQAPYVQKCYQFNFSGLPLTEEKIPQTSLICNTFYLIKKIIDMF